MTISSLDYSKALGQKTQEQLETIDRMRDTHKKERATSEEAHEGAEKRLSENYAKAKEKSDETFSNETQKLSEKSREKFSQEQEAYNKKLNQEREDFGQQHIKESKEFRERLGDLKRTYDGDTAREHKADSDLRANAENRYVKKIDELRDMNEKSVEKLVKGTVGANDAFRERVKGQEREMAKDHADEVADMRKKQSNDKNDWRYSTKRHIELLEDGSRRENEQITAQAKQTVDRMAKSQNERIQEMTTRHEDDNAHFREIRSYEKKEADRGFDARVDKLKKDHLDEKLRDRLKNGMSTEGVDMRAQIANEREKQIKENYENRIDNIKERVGAVEKEYTEKSHDASMQGMESLRDQKVRDSRLLADVQRQDHEFVNDKVSELKNERVRTLDAYDARDWASNKEHVDELNRTNDRANRQYVNQRNQYEATLKDFSEKTRMSNEIAKDDEQKERTRFLTDLQKQKHEDYEKTRDAFADKMNRIKMDGDRSREDLSLANREMKDKFVDKLAEERRRNESALENQKKMFGEQRKEDYKALKDLMSKRETEMRKQMDSMRAESDFNMKKMAAEHDRRVRTMTEFYEEKLRNMATDFTRDTASKDAANVREINRSKAAWEQEKLRIVTQYESQLQQMKDTYLAVKNAKSKQGETIPG